MSHRRESSTSHPVRSPGWRFTARCKWLVETQNKILFRIAILYYTSSVQVERQMGMRIFGEKNYKNGDISGSLGRIWMRFVSSGAVICIFTHAKREVWENSVARERVGLLFWVMWFFSRESAFRSRIFDEKWISRMSVFIYVKKSFGWWEYHIVRALSHS